MHGNVLNCDMSRMLECKKKNQNNRSHAHSTLCAVCQTTENSLLSVRNKTYIIILADAKHIHLSVGNIYGSRSLTNARGGQRQRKEELVYGIVWIGYNLKKKKGCLSDVFLKTFLSIFLHVCFSFSFWLSLCCARFDNTL